MPSFTLDLRQAQSHRIDVTLRFVPQSPVQTLLLPSWTPGSYLEREYVRHLDRLEVHQGGTALDLRRLERHRWRLEPALDQEVEVHYGVLGVERSVRTNWLDGDGAFLTAAAWALLVEGQRWHPQVLRLLLPDGWQTACSLPCNDTGDGEGCSFMARDFDALVDAPIACGELRRLSFTVGGHPHHWVWQGLPEPAPVARWQQALPALAQAACELMGETAPAAAAYHLLVRFCGEGYGGLEHDDGCALLYSRRELRHADGERRLYQLVAHEYLHQWNVRRLRPRELQPYDYGGATIVPTLWFAEGVTSYFDGLVVLRAGLCSEDELLRDWSDDLSRYLTTPGRGVQTLEASSEEAWVKLYRPDAHSAGHQISYYLKGQLVALLLDLHLLASGDSLQAVLQRLWRHFGRCGRGYGPEDLFTVIGAAAPDLPGSLDRWLRSLDELPLDGYLKSVGLELLAEPVSSPATGLRLEVASGLLQVQRVDRASPAELAGLAPGDELIAIDGERLRNQEQLEGCLRADHPAELLICRDGRVRPLTLTAAAPTPVRWRLIPDPSAGSAPCLLRHRWLHGREP